MTDCEGCSTDSASPASRGQAPRTDRAGRTTTTERDKTKRANELLRQEDTQLFGRKRVAWKWHVFEAAELGALLGKGDGSSRPVRHVTIGLHRVRIPRKGHLASTGWQKAVGRPQAVSPLSTLPTTPPRGSPWGDASRAMAAPKRQLRVESSGGPSSATSVAAWDSWAVRRLEPSRSKALQCQECPRCGLLPAKRG